LAQVFVNKTNTIIYSIDIYRYIILNSCLCELLLVSFHFS